VRFLADESCDFSVVRALRAEGHDVLAITESAAGSDDTTVMDMAVREGRILLTEDKDFGQLVYAYSQRSSGVVLLRYPAAARKALPTAVTVFFSSESQTSLAGHFVVMTPGRIRRGGRAR